MLDSWPGRALFPVFFRARVVRNNCLFGACILAFTSLTCPVVFGKTAAPTAVPESATATVGPMEPTAPPTMPSYSSKDSFSFAVLGDSAPPAPGLPAPTALFKIFEDLNVLRPDLIFHTGNFIWAPAGDQNAAASQMDKFALVESDTPIPTYIAPGSKDIPDEEADVAYRKLVSGGNPWRSFDYGNSHFIVLDTEVPAEAGKIAGDQLTWLKNDLDAHTQAAHTFVFMHRNAYPRDAAPADAVFSTDTDRDAIRSLMSDHHVSAVFSGGEALYSTTTQDGVNYVNTGGGGSASSVAPTDNGFLHYLLVTVSPNNVDIHPLQPARIDLRSPGPGEATVYNMTSVPLTLNRIGVVVPAKWRNKKAGLLGAEQLSVYAVTASVSNGGAPKNTDAAPVELEKGDPRNPLTNAVDVLYVRVRVPAASAVTVKVAPAQ